MIAVVREIDTMHLGRDRVIAAHEVRGDLIVDPGPASAIDTLLAGLSGEPRAVLLTHIHLDHASATGALVRRWPDLRVYVSEVGAPHLVEPKKLLESAGRLYGPENMDRLWGEVLPVPAANVVALAGGEEVEGFRVEHVPGHASHHRGVARPRRGRRVRRRHGRRADSARGLHRGAHAAAGDRRRGLDGVARHGSRAWAPTACA